MNIESTYIPRPKVTGTARLVLNRAAPAGLTRPALMDVIRGEAAAFMQLHAVTRLQQLVDVKPFFVNEAGEITKPTLQNATPQEKREALQYGVLCGRAYARRWGRYYGLFGKYAPGGSLAATTIQ